MLEKKHVRPDALMAVSIRGEVVEVAERDVVWRGVPLCMNTSSTTKPSEFASSKVCERHVSVVAGAGDACLWCFQLNDIASVLHPLGAIDVATFSSSELSHALSSFSLEVDDDASSSSHFFGIGDEPRGGNCTPRGRHIPRSCLNDSRCEPVSVASVIRATSIAPRGCRTDAISFN